MSIHITSFNYPVDPTEEDKVNYKEWLLSIGKVLPCKFCRDNFDKNMESVKFNMDKMKSRETFSRFCYDLHDSVNRMLDKPQSPPFEEIRDRYEGFRSRCMSDEQKKELLKVQVELGCVRPLHNGTKAKCAISIVPYNSVIPNFQVDGNCQARGVE